MGKDAMNSLILTYCSISSSDKKRRSSFPLVILSEAKNLVPCRVRSFADAQDDTGEPMRLFLSDELMEQSGGINECIAPLRFTWKDVDIVSIRLTLP